MRILGYFAAALAAIIVVGPWIGFDPKCPSLSGASQDVTGGAH